MLEQGNQKLAKEELTDLIPVLEGAGLDDPDLLAAAQHLLQPQLPTCLASGLPSAIVAANMANSTEALKESLRVIFAGSRKKVANELFEQFVTSLASHLLKKTESPSL